jgi:hypothetical protein
METPTDRDDGGAVAGGELSRRRPLELGASVAGGTLVPLAWPGCSLGAQQGGVLTSDWLGRGFSGNANDLGFVDHQFDVADASIVPTALGNNPLLTITALAGRIAELIVDDPAHARLFHPPRPPEPAPESI